MLDRLIDGYTLSVLIFAGINVIAAYSFYVPFKTGQVSLGQAGFMAVGAYASAVATQKFAIPFPLALLFGGLLAGLIGVLVGFPALRIKGVYLLLLTLGFAEIISVIALSWDYVGGAQGFRGIRYNPFTLDYVFVRIFGAGGRKRSHDQRDRENNCSFGEHSLPPFLARRRRADRGKGLRDGRRIPPAPLHVFAHARW